MNHLNDKIDETTRLKQFAWEIWDHQVIAVIFRPGYSGLDRYVVKRYVEQVFYNSPRWKQLSSVFSKLSKMICAYPLTSNEIELIQEILEYHQRDQLRFRLLPANDELILFDDLLDFISHAEKLHFSHTHSSSPIKSFDRENSSIPIIPSITSVYSLPASKHILSRPNPMKSSTVKQTLPLTVNKIQGNISTNNSYVEPRETNSIRTNPTTSLENTRIDGNGWVQINNVYVPFIVKAYQRCVPYQVLVSCKVLQVDELCPMTIRATSTDIKLINSMIRNSKINNEKIPENALLINIRHVMFGTKDIIYIKILPNNSQIANINRHFKSVLTLNGGFVYIKNRQIPYICCDNQSYVPLNVISNMYPHLYTQLKAFARVPRTNEFDYLQLIHMYFDEKQIPSDTLIIKLEDLYQVQIVSTKSLTLIEYHNKEKAKVEQYIARMNNQSIRNKRKYDESHENIGSKFRSTSLTTLDHSKQKMREPFSPSNIGITSNQQRTNIL